MRRWVGNRSLSPVANVLYNTTLSDMETCYKLFDRQVLDGIDLRADRFDFEPEITAKVLRQRPPHLRGADLLRGPRATRARSSPGGTAWRPVGPWSGCGSAATPRDGARCRRRRSRRSAVVVNYDAGQLLADCVASLRGRGRRRGRGGRQRLHRRLARCGWRPADPDVHGSPSGGNLGYGAAANRGAGHRRGRYLLVCNPDLVVRPGRRRGPGRRPRRRHPGSASSAPRWSTPTAASTRRPAPFPPWSTPSATAASAWCCPATVHPPLPAARLGPRRAPAGRLGLGGAASWSGGRPGTRSAASTRRTSCTWRTSTCAGGPAGPAGASRYEPAAEVTHVQGVSSRPAPVPDDRWPTTARCWRFAWRSTRGWRRLCSRSSAAGLAGRAVLACVMRRSADRGRTAARCRRPTEGYGPRGLASDRRYGQGIFKQESGARRRHRRRPDNAGPHAVDVLPAPSWPWSCSGPRPSSPAATTSLSTISASPAATDSAAGGPGPLARGLRRRHLRQVPAADHRNQTDPTGIHTHGDGVIHIHPTSTRRRARTPPSASSRRRCT